MENVLQDTCLARTDMQFHLTSRHSWGDGYGFGNGNGGGSGDGGGGYGYYHGYGDVGDVGGNGDSNGYGNGDGYGNGYGNGYSNDFARVNNHIHPRVSADPDLRVAVHTAQLNLLIHRR